MSRRKPTLVEEPLDQPVQVVSGADTVSEKTAPSDDAAHGAGHPEVASEKTAPAVVRLRVHRVETVKNPRLFEAVTPDGQVVLVKVHPAYKDRFCPRTKTGEPMEFDARHESGLLYLLAQAVPRRKGAW